MSGDALDRKRYAQMWAEFRRVEMLNKTQRICEALDRAATYAPPNVKQDALVLARYWINRAR